MKNSDIQIQSVKGVRASMVSQLLTTIIGIIKIPVFTFFISPKEFGLIALSVAITGVIQLFKDFGYSTYIIKQQDLLDSEIDFIHSRVFVFSVIAAIITILTAVPMKFFYGYNELLIIMPFTGLQFILNGFCTIPLALLRKEMAFAKVALVEVISSLGAFLLAVLMLMFTRNYWVLLFSNLFYFLIQLIVLLIIGKLFFRWYNPFDKRFSNRSFKYGGGLTIFNILTFLSTNIDTYIIGKIGGVQVLGVYNKAYELGVITIDKVRKPIQQVYFSSINSDREHTYTYLFNHVLLLLNLLWLVSIPLILLMPKIVESYLEPGWASITDLIKPFLLSTFIWMPMSLLDQLLLLKKNINHYLILGTVKALLGTLAIIIASNSGAGAIAIAWAFFVYHIIILLPFSWFIFYNSNLRKNDVLKNLLSFLVYILIYSFPIALLVYLDYNNKLTLLGCLIVMLYCISCILILKSINTNFQNFLRFIKQIITNKV